MNRHLNYLNAMDMLLGPLPTRRQLQQMPQWPGRSKLAIRVERTMPFEFISHVLPPFLRLWDAEEAIELSEYDATLSSIGGEKPADVYILWLDWRLYRKSMSASDACDWLKERIGALRRKSDKPVLINNWPEPYEAEDQLYYIHNGKRRWFRQLNEALSRLSEETLDCWIIDLSFLALEPGGDFFDERNERVSNYPFSSRATLLIARHLGVHLLPALRSPKIKAIALDLDDTLYTGVLGEDGVEGVVLSDAHVRLQRMLQRLKQSGMMLTICSRNEDKDVKELFEQRSDFPLHWHDFAVVCANWHPKPDNLLVVSQKLNIDPSAMLFIDDNSAELLAVANRVPAVRLLRADPSGEQTIMKLCHYPGCYQLYQDDSATLRTADIQANVARTMLADQATDYVSYLKSLQMRLRIYINESTHIHRLFEMSHKTNQFNLALRRMSQTEAARAMNPDEYLTMTIQLTDILSDSGIVGAFVCRLEQEKATLIENVFSCRALGRDVETVAFACLLARLMKLGVERLSFVVQEGPRNAPAREWLQRYVSDPANAQRVADLFAQVSAACASHPVKVEEME